MRHSVELGKAHPPRLTSLQRRSRSAIGESVNARTYSFTLRRRFMGVGFTLLGLLSAFLLGMRIVYADFKTLAIWGTFGLALSACLVVLHNWRLGVVTFFVWILIEDFIRKWVGNEIILYFVKDVLIVITYLSYLFSQWKSHRERFQNPLRVPLLLMTAWAVIQFANPGVNDILVSVVGFRMSFFYIPMIYLGYSLFHDEADLSRFCTWTLSLALIVSVLGITQSVAGLDILNPVSAPGLRLHLVRMSGGVAVLRPTSIFVDAGRFASYLFIMVYIGFGLIGYLLALRSKPSIKLRTWVVFCWLIVVVGLFMSGQRAAIVWVALSVPIVGWAYVYARNPKHTSGRNFSVPRLLLIAAVGLYLMSAFFPQRFGDIFDFYDRTINPNSQYSELRSRPEGTWSAIISAYKSSGLIGHGTGTASLGLQYIKSYETGQEIENVYEAGQKSTRFYNTEGGFSSVLWEWGGVGLALWLFWSILLMVKLVQKVRELRFTRYYWIAVAVALYSFFLLFAWFYLGMQVYQQYVAQSFLWFMVGVVFRLPQLATRSDTSPIERPVQPLATPTPCISR
jgi:hypothetical protein